MKWFMTPALKLKSLMESVCVKRDPESRWKRGDMRVNVTLERAIHNSRRICFGRRRKKYGFDIWLTAVIEPGTIPCNTQSAILTHYAVNHCHQCNCYIHHKNDVVAAGKFMMAWRNPLYQFIRLFDEFFFVVHFQLISVFSTPSKYQHSIAVCGTLKSTHSHISNK